MKNRTVKKQKGFTLLEIMIVVIILGLLAVMSLPAIRNARMSAQNTRFISDLRLFRGAIDNYIFEAGDYPPDGPTGNLPAVLVDYIKQEDFERGTTLGGSWDTETNDSGVTCAIGVDDLTVSNEQLLLIDEQIDDGDIATGQLRKLANDRYYWVLVE